MNRKKSTVLILSIIVVIVLACNLPSPNGVNETASPVPLPSVTATIGLAVSDSIMPTDVSVISHVMVPSTSPSEGITVYDVSSKGTAPEKRAPYGDSYNINRLERPFKQDMSYVSDMDIVTYNLSEDANWYYISIELVGGDPNNSIGINYGVEIDNDADGFGDIIVWAEPPYTQDWGNTNVQVFEDKNHDTGGLSAEQSDAPLDTDGYETLRFDRGLGDDPDLAWVRINSGMRATVQFAFKKTLTDGTFMLGVLSDAGLQDVTKLDYNDRFTAEEAGSSVRSNKYYPLGELYLVDNSCREAFGFKPTGYEPQLCPRPEMPTSEPADVLGCTNPSQYTDGASCQAAGCAWVQNPNVTVAAVYYCTYP